MKKVIAFTTAAAVVAGCSNIGTVNGVPVNRGTTTVSTQGAPTYCEANPEICIIAGALALGAIGYLINEAGGDPTEPGDADPA